MKVLIICEKFAPENTVGAIRMTKVAKYLKKDFECDITVLLRKREQYGDLGDAIYADRFLYAEESPVCCRIMSMYRGYSNTPQYDERKRKQCREITASRSRTSLKSWLKSILSVIYSEYTPRSYCRNAMKAVRESGLEFDAVISSFGPASSHYIGREVKKMFPRAVWIADYRDPLAIGESTRGFLHGWAKGFAKRVTGTADACTVASEGFTAALGIERNVHVLTNGFDADDWEGIPETAPHHRMRMVYTGTLLAGSRDISVILSALRELIGEGSIDPGRLEIIYAGQHRREFERQFSASHLDIRMETRDRIPQKESLELQKSADLLLIATWNTAKYRGSLPLKIYEYLHTGKPVICSICGSAANSELKRMITLCSAGICHEEADHDVGFPALKKALLAYYLEFTSKGSITGTTDASRIVRYDYRSIAASFHGLMERTPRVIVAHPGKQHSLRLAASLKKAGILDCYCTTVYDSPSSLAMRILKAFLHGSSAKRAESRKSTHLDDSEVVRLCEAMGLLTVLCRRIRKNIYRKANDLTSDMFGRRVARLAIKRHADAVVCYDTASLSCWKVLNEKAPRIIRIMDVSHMARPCEKTLLENECAAIGDWTLKRDNIHLWNDRTLSRFRDEMLMTEHFLCPSEFVIRSLQQCGISPGQCLKVPYGANLSSNRPLAVHEGRIRFVFVGGATYSKGAHRLLETFSRLDPSAAQLTLVGGYDKGLYGKYSCGNIRFTGWVFPEEVKKRYAESDVFILYSLREGLAQVGIEAMACGLPVIVSDRTGVDDLVEEGVNGFTVPYGDDETLLQRLRWFTENASAIPAMGENARRKAASYTWDAYADNAADAMRKILDRR